MDNIKADAATMNAAFDALNAVVMALAETMPEPQREAFANNLARLAKNAEQKNWPVLETALLDLHRSARR